MCCNDTHAGDSLVADVLTGLVMLVVYTAKAAWWLSTKVVAPAALIAGVVVYRWLTGAPLIDDNRVKRQTFTRPVRASSRLLLTATLIGTLIAPLITAMAVTTATVAAIASVLVLRRRTRRDRAPRRVHVIVGTPVRRADPGPLAAITAVQSDRPWPGQAFRDMGRAA